MKKKINAGFFIWADTQEVCLAARPNELNVFFVDFATLFSVVEKKKGQKPMIDIEALIPHRKPIRVITEIVEVNENAGTATAVVNEHWPLCDSGRVSSLVLIEAIAQTSAFIEGHKRMLEGKSGAKGWLVGIKTAEFMTDSVPVNTPITVHVDSLYSFDNYGVIEGVVKSGENIL